MNKKSIFSFALSFVLLLTGQKLQAQTPLINFFAPISGPVGSLVTIRGSHLALPTAISFGNISAIVITASDTQAVAMVMPGTTTGPLVVTTGGGVASGNNNFIVSGSRSPNKQLGDKLFGANTENTVSPSGQGFSVAISADGNTAVVGGDFDNGNLGSVWVYTRSNNTWAQQGNKLSGTGATGAGTAQGYAVAISADGNTFIECGVGDNGFTGAAWVFTRDADGVWTQQGNKLVGTGYIIGIGSTPEQGYSVSLSADGNTAIIGGRRDNNYIGAAWIFTRSNNLWAQQAKLTGAGSMANGSQQGTSVALSANGNTAAIGGPGDSDRDGAVWIFTRNGNIWSQQGDKLVGSGGERSFLGGIQQGTSAALSADGNTLIEGGPFDTDGVIDGNGGINNNYGGAMWVFTRSGNTWHQQGNKLFATDASQGAEQGWAVSISADGNTALIGAPTDDSYTGGAWVYRRNNNVWSQYTSKLVGTGYVGAAKEGWSVSLSADGNTAIVGGPEDYYQEQGASWVFADSASIVLPVTFAGLTAYLSGNNVQIDWTGYNEINLSRYDIERSIEGPGFEKIGSVNVKEAGGANKYTWLDPAPFPGKNLYRVKAIRKDGTAQFSRIKLINTGIDRGSIRVYPNPAYSKILHLQPENIPVGNYTVKAHSADGKTISLQNILCPGGNQSLTIPLKNIAGGIYDIELASARNYYTVRVIIK